MKLNTSDYKTIILMRSLSNSDVASLLRSISQIIMGLDGDKRINLAELGIDKEVRSTLELDGLKMGIQNHTGAQSSIKIALEEMSEQGCRVIFITASDATDLEQTVSRFSEANNFNFLNILARWSEKLDVDYLSQDQLDKIMEEVERARGTVRND